MNQILRYLLDYCSFLYEPGRYRFVDSETSASFGGDAYLTLASDSVRIRFVRDRDRLLMEFQSVEEEGQFDWYSIDVVRQLVTGEPRRSARLDEDQAAFLREHLDDIEERFAPERLDETTTALKKLERTRAKELFG